MRWFGWLRKKPLPPFVALSEFFEEMSAQDDKDIDTYVMGVLRKDMITFPVTWPSTWFPKIDTTEPRTIIYGPSYHLLGVDWWDEHYSFMGTLTQISESSIQIHPEGNVETIYAASWRRRGYRALNWTSRKWWKVRHPRWN